MAEQEFAITIRFSQHLQGYTDQHLTALWHVTQANPAEYGDDDAGRATEFVGREIIRRFLAATPPTLWNHQGAHAPLAKLQRLKERLEESDSSPAAKWLKEARFMIGGALDFLDRVTATDDDQSDGIGLAENAMRQALSALERLQLPLEKCPHGIRSPHPCRECEDESPEQRKAREAKEANDGR